MFSRNPLLLPIAALLLVAGFAAAGLLFSANDPDPAPSTTDGRELPSPTAVSAQTPAPTGRQAGNVCGGTFGRPDPGEGMAFDPFYTRKRVVLGLTIVGGPGVDSKAFDVAQETIERMFANNDLDDLLVAQGAYVVIAEADQAVLDLPEFSCLEGELGSDFFTHVCGVADHADYPVATVNELDLLGNRRGPCEGVNILYHELGHLVYGWALAPADYFDARLLYTDALAAGLYEGLYASTNYNEYFAEGTQVFFDAGDPGGKRNRAWLADYDPELLTLLAAIYGED